MRPSSHKNSVRRLGFEALETRRVMAGNVQATIENGDLIIQGGDANESLLIWRGAETDHVYVGGRLTVYHLLDPARFSDDYFSEFTRVNNNVLPVLLTGFTGSIKINMGNGDDNIIIMNLTVPGAIEADLANGNDSFRLHGALDIHDLTILNDSYALFHKPTEYEAALNDTTTIFPVGPTIVKQGVSVNAGDGNDRLSYRTFSQKSAIKIPEVPPDTLPNSSTIHDHLIFNGGNGDDSITIRGNDDRGNNARTVGIDLIGTCDLLPGAGNDSVEIFSLNMQGDLNLNDSEGETKLQMYQFEIEGNLTINSTGKSIFGIHGLWVGYSFGNDNYGIAKNMTIKTGIADDTIDMTHGKFENLKIETGDGDEGNNRYGVKLNSLLINQGLYIDTGVGFDNLLLDNVEAKKARLFTGRDSDGLIVKESNIVDAYFSSGADGDQVGIYYSKFTDLTLNTFDGIDNVYLGGLNSDNLATFDTGSGSDTVFLLYPQREVLQNPQPFRKHFVSPPLISVDV